jgi:hypothetical protein
MPKPDLKAEGKTLTDLMVKARKKPHQCAILLNGPDLIVEADRKKSVKKMRALAKSKGGSARGAWGQMRFDGKTMLLTCEDEPPGSIERLIRKHYSDRGLKIKVEICVGEIDESEIDGDDEDTEEQLTRQTDTREVNSEPSPRKEDEDVSETLPDTGGQTNALSELQRRFDTLKPQIAKRLRESAAAAPKLSQLLKFFKKTHSQGDLERSRSALNGIEGLLNEPVESNATHSHGPSEVESPVLIKLKAAFKGMKEPLSKALKVGGEPAQNCKSNALTLAQALKAGDASNATKAFAELRKSVSLAAKLPEAEHAYSKRKSEMLSMLNEVLAVRHKLKLAMATNDPQSGEIKRTLKEFNAATKRRDAAAMRQCFEELRLLVDMKDNSRVDPKDAQAASTRQATQAALEPKSYVQNPCPHEQQGTALYYEAIEPVELHVNLRGHSPDAAKAEARAS